MSAPEAGAGAGATGGPVAGVVAGVGAGVVAGAVAGVGQIVEAVLRWQGEADGGRVVVAVDGHGGSGKTTLAEGAAGRLGAVVVHTDDFFRDAGPEGGRGAGDGGGLGGGGLGGGGLEPMGRYYDWKRMRAEGVLPALGAGGVVLVEGVSSAAPALADLVTHSVLVVTPEPVRVTRLRRRIRAEEWDEVWLAEERRYFAGRAAAGFDLVVSGGGG